MTSKLKVELASFFTQLESVNAPVLKYFRDGRSHEQIVELFSKINLKPTDDLVALYERCDGQSYNVPGGLLSFGMMGIFLPLEDAVKNYQGFWGNEHPGYFPIFTDDTLAIDLDKSSMGYGRIFLHSPAMLIIEPVECYTSIERMFATFTACFRENIYWYDKAEFFQEDDVKAIQLSSHMNPDSPYWRLFMK